MLSGACGPNGTAELSPSSLQVLAEMGARSVKLMWNQAPQNVRRLKERLDCEVVIRCQPTWRESYSGDPIYLGAVQYGNMVLKTIREFRDADAFQLCNEPQEGWNRRHGFQYRTPSGAHLPWPGPDYGPWQYQAFMREVVELVRRERPGVRLISPPLQWSPARFAVSPDNSYTLDEWLDAFASAQPAARYRGGRNLWQLFDYAGCNCYWQDPWQPVEGRTLQRTDGSGGYSFDLVVIKSGLQAVLCEYGSSLGTVEGTAASELELAMRDQYPQYVRELRGKGNVYSAHAFAVDGAGWEAFPVTLAVAEAVRSASGSYAAKVSSSSSSTSATP